MQRTFAGLALAAPPARAHPSGPHAETHGHVEARQPMIERLDLCRHNRGCSPSHAGRVACRSRALRRLGAGSPPRAGWTFFLAACILAAHAASVGAQSPGPAAGRSTQQGIFTREQALRGKDTFLGSCTGCHTPASHTGATFTTGWVGKSVLELFRYVSEYMPKNDPGILTAREYADLSAYLLMLNGMPAGRAELPADPAVLEKIRIDTASASRSAPRQFRR